LNRGTIKIYKNLFGEPAEVVIPASVKDVVKQVLDEVPEAQNDDMVLLAEVWKKQGIRMDYEQFKDRAFKAETIRRARQKLQEGK